MDGSGHVKTPERTVRCQRQAGEHENMRHADAVCVLPAEADHSATVSVEAWMEIAYGRVLDSQAASRQLCRAVPRTATVEVGRLPGTPIGRLHVRCEDGKIAAIKRVGNPLLVKPR